MTTLTLKRRVHLPLKAMTRVQLIRSAEALREMKAPAVFIDTNTDEVAKLKARVSELTAERNAALKSVAERAHREERVKSITLRVVDNRAGFAAKLGSKKRVPLVTITSQHITTTDVWQVPPTE